jgi:hypothetical protein
MSEESRGRSRTLWMVIGGTVIATVLLWYTKIEGGQWVNIVTVLFAGWQARRYGDNRLKANGGK